MSRSRGPLILSMDDAKRLVRREAEAAIASVSRRDGGAWRFNSWKIRIVCSALHSAIVNAGSSIVVGGVRLGLTMTAGLHGICGDSDSQMRALVRQLVRNSLRGFERRVVARWGELCGRGLEVFRRDEGIKGVILRNQVRPMK